MKRTRTTTINYRVTRGSNCCLFAQFFFFCCSVSLLLFAVIRVGSLCKMSRFSDSHSLNASWGEKWHGNNRIRNLEKNCSIAVMFNAIKPGNIIHYDRIEHVIEWWLQDVSPSIDFSIGPCSLPRTRWQNYCSFISE